MAIEILDQIHAARLCVDQLGLDGDAVGLDSPEALAASLRRAASFLCPTGPGRLITAVEKTVGELVDPGDGMRAELETVLEAIIGYGDLLELRVRDDSQGTGNQLFLGPPGFVRRQSGSFLLVGVRPEATPLAGEEVAPFVEYRRHVRSVKARSDVDVEELLLASGLRAIAPDVWLRAPRHEDPQSLIKGYDARLAVAGPSGEIEGLRILDPGSPVSYYRGRWRPPTVSDGGRFVARRPQAFGADLWCYAEIAGGSASRLLDLPVDASLNRGCDEAWRLQAALDAVFGNPQELRVRVAGGEAKLGILDVFSPIPRWLQRRWDSLATPTRSAGALFSYAFVDEEWAEEADFATRMLWLKLWEAETNAR